ncbi:MAG TPA: protein kinase [Myxococcales bacterium]|nr:protein kinase [Myxococcales bacterium]
MSGLNPAADVPTAGAESDPLLGRVLNDRYRILEGIGRGGMGRVYKALQAPLDRVVALKVLGAGHDRDPNFYKRFFLEASVTAKLTHPNTITLYDYGRTDDGIFFIAMEYLDGRTLSQAIQSEGALAQERVIHIAQQVCRSLREAHSLGIIHRDLKPANVMLLHQQDDHDFVKVLDFGLVKFFSGVEGDQGDEITNAGTFMGSPHYIAPEQARNQGPDQRCDIYSLGVLLYHMLTAQVPFTAPAPVDIILKHLHEDPVPPSEIRDDGSISPELEQIVLRCLAKAREDRFQSMDELLAQLKSVRAQLTGASGPHSLPPASDSAAPPSAAAPVAHTPPTPHPGLRTPSGPMSSLKSTPERGTPHASRPPPPPPDAMVDEGPALQWREAGSGQTAQARAANPSWRSSPAAQWTARNWPALRVVAAPALIVLGGIGTAAYVLRAPTLSVPPPPVAQAPRMVAAAPVTPSAETAPPAPAPPAQPDYPASFAGTTLVMVTSMPSGAEVHDAANRFVGLTPFDLRVPNNKPLQLTVRHDGYRPATINRKISGVRMSLNVTLKSARTDPYEPHSVKKSIGYKDDPY